MKRLFFFFVYIIILFAEHLSASVTFPFKKHQVSDGLSHNTVWSILQDSYGFIWIGTSNGLNCYDGYTNRVYRHVEGDTSSLGNNFVSSLMEDNQDIWIGTNNGVYIYHRSTDSFSFFDKKTKYDVFISCEVTEIHKVDNGLIWIATLGQGIFVYNPQTGVLRQNILQNSFAGDICQGVDGRIYISSINKGVFVFDQMGYFLSTLSSLTDEAEERKKINGLLSTSEGLWFSSENTLECYSEKEKTVSSYPLPSSVSVLCMIEYDSEQLLIGTNTGLFIFGRQSKEWKKVETTGEYAMSNPVVNAMMLDAEGTLWLATNGGVNYMPRQLRRFEHHIIPMGQKIAQGINAFCEKENGEVYIGTQSGLWLYQPLTQSMTECRLYPYTDR
ncbi:MAG: hybrid sensor histidine kinase/response regulator, partial [Muribaculaceae bacterium]|nr:hybrid sensor histidine kinase/response regulator [Muribaculaceae bacterium]